MGGLDEILVGWRKQSGGYGLKIGGNQMLRAPWQENEENEPRWANDYQKIAFQYFFCYISKKAAQKFMKVNKRTYQLLP